MADISRIFEREIKKSEFPFVPLTDSWKISIPSVCDLTSKGGQIDFLIARECLISNFVNGLLFFLSFSFL